MFWKIKINFDSASIKLATAAAEADRKTRKTAAAAWDAGKTGAVNIETHSLTHSLTFSLTHSGSEFFCSSIFC